MGRETLYDYEAKAREFVAENEPLLKRATPATLHRIILHGSEIATHLSEEVVEEMGSHEASIRELTEAINDPDTPPARIQELEEEQMRLMDDKDANGQTKQAAFNELAALLDRAITLRQEREVLEELPDMPAFRGQMPDFPTQEEHAERKAKVPPKRGFWSRLFGKRS